MLKKINFLNILMYLSFFIIITRIYYLQVVKLDYYQEKLLKLTEKEIKGDELPRGRIYDTSGNIIVDNRLVPIIYFKNNNNLTTKELIKLAYKIKDHIELDYSKLTNSYLKDFYLLEHDNEIKKRVNKLDLENYKKRKISDNSFYKIKKDLVSDDDLSIYDDNDKKAIYLYFLMNNGYSYQDKIIKKDASIEEFAYFSESNTYLSGFNTKYMYDRYYPYNDTFKSILGSIGSIPYEKKSEYLEKGYSLDDTVGLTNLEYVYDTYLKSERDTYKLVNGEYSLIKEGHMGKDLYLTIDIKLQEYAENVLSEELSKSKVGINTKYFDRSYLSITNPNNGEVLAMVGKRINLDKISDYSIGVITDTMTPGSVVKGASILVGYNENKLRIGEVMKDECIKIKATPKKCSIYTMGYINDLEALYKSSNVYQFKIAIRVGGGVYNYDMPLYINDKAFDTYRNYYHMFGLGVKTGIELKNESIGYMGKTKNVGLLMNLAIGQYDTYTNLQINQYMSTLATGKRYEMHLLKYVKDKDEIVLKYEPNILNTLDIKETYLNRVRLGLKMVMTNGTGYGYVNLNLNPSGKTGTSETFVDSNLDGKYETETISTSFATYFPSNNPNTVIAITSPNISYKNKTSSYIYPFNKLVIQRVSNYFLN